MVTERQHPTHRAPPQDAGMNVSTKKYVDGQVRSARKRIEARLDAMDTAVELNHQTLTIRLEHANGAFKHLERSSEEFARKPEVAALAQRLESLEQFRATHEGEGAGRQPLVSMGMVVVASVIAAVVSFVAARLVP